LPLQAKKLYHREILILKRILAEVRTENKIVGSRQMIEGDWQLAGKRRHLFAGCLIFSS
jgi:hypothetical protein